MPTNTAHTLALQTYAWHPTSIYEHFRRSLLFYGPFSDTFHLFDVIDFLKFGCSLHCLTNFMLVAINIFRKQSILLPSPIHFIRLTPSIKFRFTLLPSTIPFGSIYPLIRFLFFISLCMI
jgi:hypothetical protein